MTDRVPVEVTNLDRYGSAVLPWSRPRDLLTAKSASPDITFFLGTTRPDGRPHAAGIGALWRDGDGTSTDLPSTPSLASPPQSRMGQPAGALNADER